MNLPPEVMQNFNEALLMMGQGMGGIMAVILIITLLVVFLSKINAYLDLRKAEEKNNENGGAPRA